MIFEDEAFAKARRAAVRRVQERAAKEQSLTLAGKAVRAFKLNALRIVRWLFIRSSEHQVH